MSKKQMWAFAVLLAVAWGVIILIGLIKSPLVTVIVGALVVVPVGAIWARVCKNQGVPFLLWEKKEVGKDDETGTLILITRIVIFGLVEIRNIPQKFSWVVRNPFSPNDDATDPQSYEALGQGWQKIVLPELKRVEVRMVDLRTQGLDTKRRRVNTQTNPVDLDSTLLYWVKDPILFAITLKGKAGEVIEQALSVALNYVTTGYTDVELMEIADQGELMTLAEEATKIMNGGVAHEVPDIGRFGIEVVVGIQNVFPLEGVLDSMAKLTEAELGARAAVKRGEALHSLREGAGMPDKSAFNILLPLAEGLQQTFAGGKAGLRFPSVTLDLGGVEPSGAKGGSGKGESEEDKSTGGEVPEKKGKGRKK